MILLVDVGEEAARRLAPAGDGTVRCVGAAELELAAAEAGDPPLAVLAAAGVQNPVALAQRVHSRGWDSAVLLLSPPDRLEELRRAILFAPFLGPDVSAWSDAETDVVAAELADAADRTRRRRDHRQALSSAQARLSATPTAVHATRYLGHLLGHLPVGVLSLDEEGRVVAINDCARALLEVDERRALGRTVDELLPGGPGRDLRHKIAAHDGTPALLELPDAGRSLDVTLSRYTTPGDEPRTLVAFVDATERVRSERERDHVVNRLRQVQGITDAALARLDLDELLDELLERICAMLGLDTAAVLLCEPGADRLTVRASRGPGAAMSHRPREVAGDDFASRVASERRALRHGGDPEGGGDRGSLLGVPLLTGDELLGVLQVGKGQRDAFSDDDETLLRLVAVRAALAINHSRLYNRQHEIAETLQRSLLPARLPVVPDASLGAAYLPAATGSEVGGDWYDALETGDGRLCLVIGDVVGRGVAAASITGTLRNSVRAYLLEGHGPRQTLTLLNRMAGRLRLSAMATVAVVEVDATAGAIRAAGAGHPAPLLDAPGSAPRLLWDTAAGPPVGAIDDVDYGEVAATLPRGGALVLYTDGLVERRREPLDTGLARLADAVRSGPRDAGALTRHLLDELLHDEAGADDVALLVMRTTSDVGSLAIERLGRPEDLGQMRQALREWLTAQGASDTEIMDLLLAAGEACANVVMHAYPKGEHGPLVLRAEREGRDAVITVRDEGDWNPRATAGAGLGMPLMRSLTDAVDVERGPRGTTVRIRRKLAGP